MFIALLLMNIWHPGKVLTDKPVKFEQFDGTLLQNYNTPGQNGQYAPTTQFAQNTQYGGQAR